MSELANEEEDLSSSSLFSLKSETSLFPSLASLSPLSYHEILGPDALDGPAGVPSREKWE